MVLKNLWFSPARRGINPTVIFFFVALAAFVVGISLPSFSILAFMGGFIMVVYIIVLVVWIFFNK